MVATECYRLSHPITTQTAKKTIQETYLNFYNMLKLGKKLLQVVENELIKNDIKILNIPTQKENFEACSFYEKQGYKVKQSIIIKHFWRNDSI